jgi:hypothetical protein
MIAFQPSTRDQSHSAGSTGINLPSENAKFDTGADCVSAPSHWIAGGRLENKSHMEQTLKGRRIAALAADDFEKVELTVAMYALRLAGAEVDVVSLREGHIRGVNLHEPGGRIGVDRVSWMKPT